MLRSQRDFVTTSVNRLQKIAESRQGGENRSHASPRCDTGTVEKSGHFQ
jgi:hypothetical protein